MSALFCRVRSPLSRIFCGQFCGDICRLFAEACETLAAVCTVVVAGDLR